MNIYDIQKEHRKMQETLTKAAKIRKFQIIDEMLGDKIQTKAHFLLLEQSIRSMEIIAYMEIDYVKDIIDFYLVNSDYTEVPTFLADEFSGSVFHFDVKQAFGVEFL